MAQDSTPPTSTASTYPHIALSHSALIDSSPIAQSHISTTTNITSQAPSLEHLRTQMKSILREIPNYPKPGILFYDITTLLENASCLQAIIAFLHVRYKDSNLTHVVGIESRGFTIGAALAYALGVGFVLIRKKGKLPYHTYAQEYDLEYGTDTLEIHTDAFANALHQGKTPRVVLVDDLLATGGTAQASLDLLIKAGGECIEACFLIRLLALNGANKLSVPCLSLLDC